MAVRTETRAKAEAESSPEAMRQATSILAVACGMTVYPAAHSKGLDQVRAGKCGRTGVPQLRIRPGTAAGKSTSSACRPVRWQRCGRQTFVLGMKGQECTESKHVPVHDEIGFGLAKRTFLEKQIDTDFTKKPRPMQMKQLIAACVLGLFGQNAEAEQKPLKVFILVGQSNMQGHAHVRTLEHIGMDPKTAPLLREMRDDNGGARVCRDVWISYLSSSGEKRGQLTAGFGADENKIGPELTFGIYMQKMLKEPILIIKTAWGGKSLHTDFRSPSAGPYQFNDTQLEGFRKQDKDIEAIKADRAKATGHYYRLTINHVKTVLANIDRVYPDYESDQRYELAGLVWFQGWNDMVDRGVYPSRDKPGGYDQYSETLACFIRDVRKDLSAPLLPFVIGVMGAGGPIDKYLPEQQRYAGIHHNFRNAMAAPADLPEFTGNVATVLTEDYWDMQLVDLRARDAKVKRKARELQSGRRLSREDQQAAQEKLRNEEFSDRELEILKTGVSNAEYHYLGSAKIMAQIGKGFAEAITQMQEKRSTHR